MVQIFMLGGSWSGGTSDKNAEILDPEGAKWALLPNIKATSIFTNDPAGKYRADNHAWFFGWSGGTGALPEELKRDCAALHACIAAGHEAVCCRAHVAAGTPG